MTPEFSLFRFSRSDARPARIAFSSAYRPCSGQPLDGLQTFDVVLRSQARSDLANLVSCSFQGFAAARYKR